MKEAISLHTTHSPLCLRASVRGLLFLLFVVENFFLCMYTKLY